MSEQSPQPSQSSGVEQPSAKAFLIQEGYTPPPMATVRPAQPLSDEIRGYTPPPMPVVLKPQAGQGTSPTSSQPSPTPQPASAQGSAGESGGNQ